MVVPPFRKQWLSSPRPSVSSGGYPPAFRGWYLPPGRPVAAEGAPCRLAVVIALPPPGRPAVVITPRQSGSGSYPWRAGSGFPSPCCPAAEVVDNHRPSSGSGCCPLPSSGSSGGCPRPSGDSDGHPRPPGSGC